VEAATTRWGSSGIPLCMTHYSRWRNWVIDVQCGTKLRVTQTRAEVGVGAAEPGRQAGGRPEAGPACPRPGILRLARLQVRAAQVWLVWCRAHI
jgi:hypothetical protein